ncbi:MAG: radical SAM protein [Coriobacteriia bacterium]|nr:radical SAM protein [Coriobacteriia bacterium]
MVFDIRCSKRIALIEAGSPGLNIYSHVAMGRGVPLLATVLRDAGYDVRAFVEDVSGRGSVDREFVASADVVGFSAITCTMPRTAELLAAVREANPKAIVVFGGPEPTCAPMRSLDLEADFILRGEAELTFPRLLAVLFGDSAERLEDIHGLIWRDDAGLHEGPLSRQLSHEELDVLPLVDRSLVLDAQQASVAWAWRARGCPSRCDFCEVCEIWPRYVVRSDEHALDELMQAQDAGYPTTFLVDDNAAANKGAFEKFLASVAERGFARTLVTQIRADSAFTGDGRIDKQFLKLLRKAATVTIVCIGVESSSDESLASLGKGIDSKRTARALRAMKRAGLVIHGMFIALADDTRETVRRNGEYARKYVSSLQYLFEVPLPGTKRTRVHEAAHALLFEKTDDLAYYDGMHVVIKPRKMAPVEMQELVAEQYRAFYSVRRIVLTAVRAVFARWRHLGTAQRKFLARFGPWRRLYWWGRLHLEYKLAPVHALAVGHRRVRSFMSDPDYSRYLERLNRL